MGHFLLSRFFPTSSGLQGFFKPVWIFFLEFTFCRNFSSVFALHDFFIFSPGFVLIGSFGTRFNR